MRLQVTAFYGFLSISYLDRLLSARQFSISEPFNSLLVRFMISHFGGLREDQILEETTPVVGFVRMILHSNKDVLIGFGCFLVLDIASSLGWRQELVHHFS